MKRQTWIVSLALFCSTLAIAFGCARSPQEAPTPEATIAPPFSITMGYSSWPGWWPWAIAEQEGLFAKHGLDVRLRWFDNYVASMEAFAAGQLDANCQTLSDTISFAADAIYGEVAVLVNDNSAGNDKIVAAPAIDTVADLQGRDVAVEAGVVDDFLLALALEDAGLSRNDVNIVPMDTGEAAAAFAEGQFDAVGAFPPFWAIALAREGSKELISSAAFPGAIPDLLVTSSNLIDSHPEAVQGLVDTWFDILSFMEANPDRADEIMAERANIRPEDLQQFKAGTKIFSVEDNLRAFSPGNTMEHMPFAARKMASFSFEVGFLPEVPPLEPLLDGSFVQAYADRQSAASATVRDDDVSGAK